MRVEVFFENHTVSPDALLEAGLPPKRQIERIKYLLNNIESDVVVHTQSPYVVQAIDKFSKEYGIEAIYHIRNERDSKYNVDVKEVYSILVEPIKELL